MAWKVDAANGIHLPQIGWHLDGKRSCPRSFVSHAHADHLGRHKLVLCSRATLRLMQARMPGKREELVLPWDVPHTLEDGTRLSLHPAGHIVGSAQLLAENEHGRLLYTGDFKLRPGLAAEVCATPRADTVIMETTFGVPRYVFPPTEEIIAAMIAFCHEAVAEGKVPVFFAYSLGKSQEVLRCLKGSGLPVMLHKDTWKMTRLYPGLGVKLPPFRRFELNEVPGHVVICPPQSASSEWLTRIGPRRTAVVSGWALDSGAIYRYRCDAAFPLSDHAGYDDLIRFVELTGATRVFTVHGFTTEFAADLRRRGIEAWALGQENQLEFPLTSPHS